METDEISFDMLLIEEPIALASLKEMAARQFGDMVKAVVDVENKRMAIGAELHSDEESFLIGRGSAQEDLWGINIYPALPPGERVEFDSMINVRPAQGNRSRDVENPDVREAVRQVIRGLVRDA